VIHFSSSTSDSSLIVVYVIIKSSSSHSAEVLSDHRQISGHLHAVNMPFTLMAMSAISTRSYGASSSPTLASRSAASRTSAAVLRRLAMLAEMSQTLSVAASSVSTFGFCMEQLLVG
jgi:hypothetical protein